MSREFWRKVEPLYRDAGNEAIPDTQENRLEYIDEHKDELLEWLKEGYPDILDEFIEHYMWDYKESLS